MTDTIGILYVLHSYKFNVKYHIVKAQFTNTKSWNIREFVNYLSVLYLVTPFIRQCRVSWENINEKI